MKSTFLLPLSVLLLSACSLPGTAKNPPPEIPTGTPTPSMTQSITASDLALHNTPENCWLAIDGKVYDVSSFGDKHPGGEAVYQGCGKDATELFNTRPMGSGTPHSDKARNNLPNFYIGDLQH